MSNIQVKNNKTQLTNVSVELKEKIKQAYFYWKSIQEYEKKLKELKKEIEGEIRQQFPSNEKTMIISVDDIKIKAVKGTAQLSPIKNEQSIKNIQDLLSTEKFEELFEVRSELIPTELARTLFEENCLDEILTDQEKDNLIKLLQINGGSVAIHFPSRRKNWKKY